MFSIAITLLILNLKVPKYQDLNGVPLRWVLLQQWPSFFAFATSFLTILIMWINHHKLFVHIRRTNHTFLILNGLLLFLVTFVPFPTAVLAEYMRYPEACSAVALYSGTYFVIALVYNALWLYASHRHRLLASNVDAARVRAITEQYRFGPIFYGIALVASLWNYYVSVAICAALALFFAIPEKVRS